MRRPLFIAEQARHATGMLGRIIAFIMARETWNENLRAMDALDLQPGDHILDVGCGHGRSLGELARRAPQGCVAGADPSDLMAELAVSRNRALVKQGRARVVIATAADLPFADSAFDKALCVHVVYFWKDLDASFREIARVMKPGARFALVFRTDADAKAVQAFPPDVYRFRSLADVEAALTRAGFRVEPVGQAEAGRPVLLLAHRQ